jgi:hypothetical protein
MTLKKLKKLLIANRGEIAIRITEAAAELGLETVAIFSEDGAKSLHVIRADETYPLRGTGVAAYLDAEQIVSVAQQTGCDAIHSGYGFLSENAEFACQCAAADIVFVGPRPDLLDLFGNKVRARQVVSQCEVPVLAGSEGPTSLAETKAFFQSIGPNAAIVIKALAGGGGRGMRVVRSLDAVEEAYQRCQSEVRAAFGNGDVYAEQFMPAARHIEVQILGDHAGNITHLWERECTVQRRHQKFIEIAPSPSLTPATREQLIAAALRMAQHVRYENLGTIKRPLVSHYQEFVMKRALFVVVWMASVFCGGVQTGHAQGGMSLGADLGGLGSMNLGGLTGGGAAMPGAIVVKLRGEVQCMDCTLEELGVDQEPGDLYQLSHDKTHMVIKITQAGPSTAWELVERHKFFLTPGEFPQKLEQLLNESKAGKQVQLIGGVAPSNGYFVPLSVKVR